MSMGTGTPPMNILEPIIKAQMEKELFKNLGGFIVGYAIDAAMFGMMLVMLTDWLRYAPKESKTIRAVLVSTEGSRSSALVVCLFFARLLFVI